MHIEYKKLLKDLNKKLEESKGGMIDAQFIARPNDANILKWYFIIFNLPDTPYSGGYYMG